MLYVQPVLPVYAFAETRDLSFLCFTPKKNLVLFFESKNLETFYTSYKSFTEKKGKCT